MKTTSCLILSLALLGNLAVVDPVLADDPSQPEAIENWGRTINPDSDCEFKAEGSKLKITVPGSPTPHDLATELNSMSAPRVVQPVNGDFVIEVKVEGEFDPGGDSTQQGRTGYTGAGLAIFADTRNYATIARATLHHAGGEPHPYTNFELRVNGELERIGTTGDFKTPAADKPLWLRLEKVGDQIRGAMSLDGEKWTYGEPKQLTSDAWQKNNIFAGVAAVSTSRKPFTPMYSALKIGKPDEAGKSAPEKTETKETAPKQEEEKVEKEKP